MATKLWNQTINKYINWGGEKNTNGLPVSGEKIQEFIKTSLNNKFGKLYYDKDPIPGFDSYENTNKYLIFADDIDFGLWLSDPINNGYLIMDTFDAPAPANIEILDMSNQRVTLLLADKDKATFSFKYGVKGSGDSLYTMSPMSYSISISNDIYGVTNIPTQSLSALENDDNTGEFTYNELGKYLKNGINVVTVTLTSKLFNVSTKIVYQYKLLDLSLTCNNFNYTQGINLSTGGLELELTANGMGSKFLNVFIDGNQITDIKGIMNQVSEDINIGSDTKVVYPLQIPFTYTNSNDVVVNKSWATTNRLHNIQIYFFIVDESGKQIKSNTIYYDFALIDTISQQHKSYILFNREFSDGKIIADNEIMTIEAEQYIPFTVNYGVFDTLGGSNTEDHLIVINATIYNEDNEQILVSSNGVESGTTSSFTFTLDTYGQFRLVLENTNQGETKELNINVKQSSVQINKVIGNTLKLELTAVNKNNYNDKNKWSYVYDSGFKTTTYIAQFNNVLWNNQNGWIDDCLVLNNGATVTIPISIFDQYSTSGLTFEIDFETENVQDDDAIIMQYGNDSTEHIYIKACSAELQSNSKNNIHTNYKDGARQTIQFIFGYNNSDTSIAEGYEMPYLMYIVVNGILDRVTQFNSSDSIQNIADEFTIGNMDNKVTTKIHSIRIYSKALSLNECIQNYIINMSSNIINDYKRNIDIYNTDGTTINIENILNNIKVPVMTIYGDVTDSIVKQFNKKSNVPVDVLYQDPNNPEFNFFVRDAWLSNQGTSSMNYPRRNLRLYFNKKSDSETLYGNASIERYDYQTRIWWGLTDSQIITDIQLGNIDDLDAPIQDRTDSNKYYYPLFNKKSFETEKYAKIDRDTAIMFIHSGIKVYKDDFTPLKKLYNDDDTLAYSGDIYTLGAYTRFKSKDLFTDRWTLKCDYAESSMTHNAGVGRLWGEALRNFTHDDGIRILAGNISNYVKKYAGYSDGDRINDNKPGRTNAQVAVDDYNEKHKNETISINGQTYTKTFGDIRTSCDGYPIIIINRPRQKNGDEYLEKYGAPVFLGLYNIMTDKGSTPLFGFETLKDEYGKTLFDASKCECWECLQNSSGIAQMNNLVTDNKDGGDVGYSTKFNSKGKYESGGSDNDDRPIWKTYEARWPDNDDLNDTKTNNLETVIRFVNFCKDALSVTVDGRDGYNLSDFANISVDQAVELSQCNTVEEAINLTNDEESSLYGLNLKQWNKLLYLAVPKTEYKEKTSDFYQTTKDSDGNVVIVRDEYTKLPILKDISEWGSIVSKKIYFYQEYNVQNVTGQTFKPLYDSGDNVDYKIRQVQNQLESQTSHVYAESVSDDPNEINYVQTSYDEEYNTNPEKSLWYILDKSYDRSKIEKELNLSIIKDEIRTGKVLTYDGKRYVNKSTGDKLWGNESDPKPLGSHSEEAWVTVYLTPQGSNRYTYVNEMGTITQYTSGEDIIIEKTSGNVTGISANDSFVGKTLFDYFKDKKYEHFDIWKLAAYYVYLMRFAAVDQVIKNTMMTTEDGIHYYFINYDNDTTLGVRNDGYLVYDWKVNRETYDESIGSYAYAGFGSVLWNLLEFDDDFMDKVQKVASAMVNSNVLTYEITLDMFNNKQAGSWSEALYNNSELYKYIGIFNDIDNKNNPNKYSPYSNAKYLPFVQGSRASHREWWLRHRFDYYDSMWRAGKYEQDRIEFYMGVKLEGNDNGSKETFTIVPASKFYFTWLNDNKVFSNNFLELEADIPHTFIATNNIIVQSQPCQFLGAQKAKILDFSNVRDTFGASISFFPESDIDLNPSIKEVIFGGDKTKDEADPCSVGQIIGLDKLTALEVLDIRTCNLNDKNLDISKLYNLKKFLAAESNISTFIPANGLILEEVSLPESITTIKLNNLSIDKFDYVPTRELKSFEAHNITGTAFEGDKLFEFILKWYLEIKEMNLNVKQYKCNISFNRIELKPTYELADYPKLRAILNEGETSISCIDLINKIKNDFGLTPNTINNTYDENFTINAGVLKVYGNGENGGLTEEDYYNLKDSIYIDNTINIKQNLWNPNSFTSNNKFHFDADTSIFISLTDINNNSDVKFIKKNQTDDYNVVSGQDILLRITVFPAKVDRQIEFIPYNIDNSRWSWDQSNNYYRTNNSNNCSTLKNNNNNTATISFEELTNNDKVYRISIIDKTDSAISKDVYITADKMVRPDVNNDISCLRMLDDGTVQKFNKSNIDNLYKIITYEYTVDFNLDDDQSYDDKYNVSIASIMPSFDANSIDQDDDIGTLNIIENDSENNSFKFSFTPKISQDSFNNNISSKSISIYLFITYKSRTNNTKKTNINITINKKDINNINLSFNAEDGEIEYNSVNNDEIFDLKHYVKEYKSKLTYHYNININPDDFNVPITTMLIENISPENSSARSSIRFENINTSNNGQITDFDIVYNTSKRSIEEKGQIKITINTEFYKIERICNITIGMYFVDEIKLLRKLDDSSAKFEIDDNTNNLTILSGITPKYIYEFHCYSKIGEEWYVWGNTSDDYVNNLYGDNTHYIINTPVYNQSITLQKNDDYYNLLDTDESQINFDQITIVNTENGYQNSDVNSFKITINNPNIFTYKCRLIYKITALGIEKEYNKEFVINRIAALANNYNIESPSIIPYGETKDDTQSDGIYFLDKDCNIYDWYGLSNQINHIDIDFDQFIIAMLFVYKNSDDKKDYISLDPWKINESGYYWHSNSDYAFNANLKGLNINSHPDLARLIGGNGANPDSIIHTYNSLNNPIKQKRYFAYIYKKCYDFYRYSCYNLQQKDPSGQMTANPYNGSDIAFSLLVTNNNYSSNDYYMGLYNNDLIIQPNITDESSANKYGQKMLFYHINDYNVNNNNSLVCMPLSSEDLTILFTYFELFEESLNRFYASYVSNDSYLSNKYQDQFGDLLINNITSLSPSEYKFQGSNGESMHTVQQLTDDSPQLPELMIKIDGTINQVDNTKQYINLPYSKYFRTFDKDDIMSNLDNMLYTQYGSSFIQIWLVGNTIVLGENIDAESSNTDSGYNYSSLLHNTNLANCLFGVHTCNY